jgi:hypothetical protein
METVSEPNPNSLSRVSDGQLAELFQQKSNDLPFLDILNEELKRRNTDEANHLHVQVIQARRTLVRQTVQPVSGVDATRPGPVHDWLHAFFAARQMARPDGRPFYRYRMSDDEYQEAKKVLRQLASAGRLANPDQSAGALFVAYCAEWFRRDSESTFLRWEDPAPDIFSSVPYSGKQQLTEFGLHYWQRPLRRSAYAREFLLTLALEGGFPVRILQNGAHGWLKEYLRAIMRRAIASRVDAPDELLAIAEEERGRMRKSYQHDDFVALCAELAGSLLDFRRKAEAEGAPGVRNSMLLDSRYPGWRDELPIYVPAEDEALVNELLSGLMDEKMTGLTTEGVEARRFLTKRDGEWHPALQLLADGEVPPAKLPDLPTTGRARAIAAGELGNHLAGEMALFEPPIGEQRRWRVRPYMRTAELLIDFPFTAAVTTTINSPDGAPCSWIWPRGEALRSDVLVFELDEASTQQESLLGFLRAGSVSSLAKTLYVLVPRDWTIEPATENAVTDIEDVSVLGCKLARLTGAAYFRGGESDSARFKVEPNSEGRDHELELRPLIPAGFALTDNRLEMIASPTQPLVREGRKQARPPGSGELFVRRPGGKWAPLAGQLSGAGFVELSWRDPAANIQIEKRQLALVPEDACIIGRMKDALAAEIRLQGMPGWTASVRETACTVGSTEASNLCIRFTERPVYRLPMTLRPPEGQSFDVIVPLIGRDAVIALADGMILAPGRQIDVGALRGAVAVSPGKTILHVCAKGSRSGGINASIDGELPLGILRGAIDETLATLPDQSDLVEIEFVGDSRPPFRISRYRFQQLARDGITGTNAASGSMAARRAANA